MARLSAHGKEIARFSKIEQSNTLSETQYAIFEDRWVLKKLKIFQEASLYSPARWHDYGWKLFRKVKEGHTESWIEKVEKAGLTRLKPRNG